MKLPTEYAFIHGLAPLEERFAEYFEDNAIVEFLGFGSLKEDLPEDNEVSDLPAARFTSRALASNGERVAMMLPFNPDAWADVPEGFLERLENVIQESVENMFRQVEEAERAANVPGLTDVPRPMIMRLNIDVSVDHAGNYFDVDLKVRMPRKGLAPEEMVTPLARAIKRAFTKVQDELYAPSEEEDEE